MARITNFLSRSNALLTTDDDFRIIPVASFTCGWTSTNSASTVVSTDVSVNTRYAIRLAPSSAGEIVLELTDFPLLLEDNEKTLSFNAKIKGFSEFQTSTSLFIDGDDSEITPNDQSHGAGLYSAVHSNIVVVEPGLETRTATVRISITAHNSGILLFTNPHLIDDDAFLDNYFVIAAREYLPDFYWDIDSLQESPRYPFFKLLDALTSTAGDTEREYNAIYGFESEELLTQDQKLEYWGLSSLVSPNVVRPDYVPWLIQFTGNSLHRNFILGDGSSYFDNHALERDFLEWQLANSYFGRGAGTRRAMIEAVKQILIKTKDGEPSTRAVALTQKFGGDPFAIRIQTLTNETFDANEDESSDLVLKLANLAKPIGYKVTHNTVDEFFFTLDDITLGLINEQRLQ
jgi:hypothetical protein